MTRKSTNYILLILLFVLLGCAKKQNEDSIQTHGTPESISTSSENFSYPITNTLDTTSYPIVEELGNPINSTQDTQAYPVDYENYQTVIDIDDLSPPKDAKPPEEGKASISGLLYQTQGSLILKNLDFFLSPAVAREDQMVVSPIITYPNPTRGDVIGKTDANGVFYINNIPPGEYFLIIIFPDRTVVAKPDQTSDVEFLISISEADQIPLGVLFINN